METEVKLLFDPLRRQEIEQHPALAGVAAQDDHVVTTYYDTADLALQRRAMVLRLRRSETGLIQTVKTAEGDPAAPLSRGEWEWRVAGPGPDLACIEAEPALRDAFAGLAERLDPVFESRVTRRRRDVLLEGKTLVEVVIDDGVIVAGDASQPIAEIELEHKGGPEAPLYGLARDLVLRHGLRLGTLSKAERGYALVTERQPEVAEAAEPVLPRDITLGEAFPRLIAATLRGFIANLEPARRGEIEGVHRLRAAIRKLRTLLVLFRPHLDAAEAGRLNAELRDLGAVLGRGRDWDVFITETLAEAEPEIGAAVAEGLRAGAEACREVARAEVEAAIAGPVPTQLVLDFAGWAAARDWLAEGRARATFADDVPDLLDRLWRRVRRRGRGLRHLAPEELHDLRKALKKLRFASEDVRSLFKARAVQRFVRRGKDVLQDLGRINDAAVSRTRVEEAVRNVRSGGVVDVSAFLDWNERRQAKALDSLKESWARFARTKPFWD